MLSSMIQLVPGGHLRMGSLQLTLRRQWDQIGQSQLVEWSPGIQDVLSWWLDRDRFVLGVSLEQVSPQLELWSDASDVGWGAHLAELVASGLWLWKTSSARSMHGSQRALKWFAPLLAGSSVAVFADNSTAVSYLRNQGGTRSSFLNSIAQRILRWAEDLSVVSLQVYYGETQCPGGRSFSPKPDLGLRVDADAGGLRGSVQEVAGFDRPVCNISGSQMFPIFFSLPRSQCSGDGCASSKLEWVAGVCLSSLVSHSDGFEEAPVVLWSHSDHRSSILASEAGVSGSSGSGGRQPVALPQFRDLLRQPHFPRFSSGGVQAVSSCLGPI